MFIRMTTRSLLAVLVMAVVFMEAHRKTAQAAELDANGYSYLNSARQFFDTGMEAKNKAQAFSSLMPNEDPRAARMLRDSINKATGSFNPPHFVCFLFFGCQRERERASSSF